MNGRDLLEAMSFLDEELIAKSEPKPRSFRWQWAVTLAACFCAVLLGSFYLNSLYGLKEADTTSAQFALAQETGGTEALRDMVVGMGTPEMNPDNGQEGLSVLIRVEERTEDGFRGITLEAGDDWSEGTSLLVVVSQPEELIPGEAYRIWIETFDPDTLRVTISRIEPEKAD